MSSKELVKELVSDAQLLIKRQVELAKLEARQQIKKELRMAELMSVGGATGYAGVIVLLVAAALAIGAALGQLWLGALIVGAALLAIAATFAAIGWSKRVRKALPHSTSEVKKEIEWARHQITT
jgi:hypothetical protein